MWISFAIVQASSRLIFYIGIDQQDLIFSFFSTSIASFQLYTLFFVSFILCRITILVRNRRDGIDPMAFNVVTFFFFFVFERVFFFFFCINVVFFFVHFFLSYSFFFPFCQEYNFFHRLAIFLIHRSRIHIFK